MNLLKKKQLIILLSAAAGIILIGGILLIILLSGDNGQNPGSSAVSGTSSGSSGTSSGSSGTISMTVDISNAGTASETDLSGAASSREGTSATPTKSSATTGGSGITSASNEVNVKDLGADSTGKSDSTQVLAYAHSLKKRVYYPNGTYLFNGKTLDFSGGVRFESMSGVKIRNSISDVSIVNFDDFGNLIGLMQNHLEVDENSQDSIAGSLVMPPVSTKKISTKADVIAYWYNDFGLQCIPQSKTGWIGWYYWTWNHHNAHTKKFTALKLDKYDPSRHPLLGFYLGDTKEALDWQAYWMYEYGVTGVSLLNQGKNGLSGWEVPGHRDYWLYQLMNNCPNFKNLKYVMNGEYSVPPASYNKTEETRVRNKFLELPEKIYSKYNNYYYVEHGGKKYPVISILEETQYKGYFNGADNVKAFYKELAKKFQSYGFGGFTLYVRAPLNLGDMTSDGVLRFETSYTPNYTVPHYTNRYTYKDLLDNFTPPSDPSKIISVATALNTQKPHESAWVCPGNTPALFSDYMKKAVAHLQKNPAMPQTLMVYNVSEWAEGGPGLVPNVQDRFGYLDAIRKNVVK